MNEYKIDFYLEKKAGREAFAQGIEGLIKQLSSKPIIRLLTFFVSLILEHIHFN